MIDMLFFPLAVISIPFLSHFTGRYYPKQLVFIYILMILVLSIPKIFTIRTTNRLFNYKWFIFLLFLIISQLTNILLNVDIDAKKLIYSLIILIICILIHYIILRIRLNNYKHITNFLKGIHLSLILVILVNLFQVGYLVYPAIFEPVINFTANNLEFQWQDFQDSSIKSQRFYAEGTYVQTHHQLNGLTEEASTNAIMIGLIYLPFLLASLKNKYYIFGKNSDISRIYYYLAVLLLILIFTQSSMAIIVFVITMIFLLKILNISSRLMILTIIGLFTLFLIGLYSDLMINYIDQYLYKLINFEVVSTINRYGYTIASIKTALQHPWGVGLNFGSSYIFQNIPDWATANAEYNLWIMYDIKPLLSTFPQLCIEFGVIIVGFIVVYSIQSVTRWKKALENLLINQNQYVKAKTLFDSYRIFLCYSSILLFTNLDWYKSYYLLLYFFFNSSLIYYENNVDSIIKLKSKYSA